MICEQFPPEAWINVYTGGSVTNDIEDNGAGIAIYLPSGRTEAPSAATPIHYNKYKAESKALMLAISIDVDSQQRSTMALSLTDAFYKP